MANKQICSVDVVDSMTDEDKLLVNIDGKLRQIKVDNIPSKIDPEEFTATKQQIINNDLWNDTKSYVVGDLIIHNNVLYECIINNVGRTPPNTEYWKPRSLYDFNKEINELNNSFDELNSKLVDVQKLNRLLYTVDDGQAAITSGSGVDINGLDQYTDIALIFNDRTQATFSTHQNETSNNVSCSIPCLAYNGSVWIPCVKYCRLDRYPNRLWIHELYDIDFYGNRYTDGRSIVGIVGVR